LFEQIWGVLMNDARLGVTSDACTVSLDVAAKDSGQRSLAKFSENEGGKQTCLLVRDIRLNSRPQFW